MRKIGERQFAFLSAVWRYTEAPDCNRYTAWISGGRRSAKIAASLLRLGLICSNTTPLHARDRQAHLLTDAGRAALAERGEGR